MTHGLAANDVDVGKDPGQPVEEAAEGIDAHSGEACQFVVLDRSDDLSVTRDQDEGLQKCLQRKVSAGVPRRE